MPSLPQLDVQVVSVVRALGASHGSNVTVEASLKWGEFVTVGSA